MKGLIVNHFALKQKQFCKAKPNILSDDFPSKLQQFTCYPHCRTLCSQWAGQHQDNTRAEAVIVLFASLTGANDLMPSILVETMNSALTFTFVPPHPSVSFRIFFFLASYTALIRG